jgi:transcriptional regulator with XRE-family HTH domain
MVKFKPVDIKGGEMSWDVAALRNALQRLADRIGYGGWKEIGEAAGLHPSGVGRIAKGETTPSVETWRKLYNAFPKDLPPPWTNGESTGDAAPEYNAILNRQSPYRRTRELSWIMAALAEADQRLLDEIKLRIESDLEKKRMMEELRTLRGIVNQSKCEPAMGENHQ